MSDYVELDDAAEPWEGHALVGTIYDHNGTGAAVMVQLGQRRWAIEPGPAAQMGRAMILAAMMCGRPVPDGFVMTEPDDPPETVDLAMRYNNRPPG